MPERPTRLDVELHGEFVAQLQERRRQGRVELTYTELARDRWQAGLPVISSSLPVRPRPQDATAFLNGLLSEGQARYTLAAQRDLPASDAFGLLASYGRDIAGALVISDPDADPTTRRPHAVGYATFDELAAAITALPDQPLGSHDDSELSLAGVQEKLLLVASSSPTGWARPAGGLPSTHILKPDPLTHPGVVVREAEALQLARAVGLTTIDPRMLDIDGRPCLVVERYDRQAGADGEVLRIHQEDLLQAVGKDPAERHGRAKYQEADGPGFIDAAALLLERATDPDEELRKLAGSMVFTVLIGNSDAHAKNLSLLLDPPGTVRLAPLYDTVPTMLFPKLEVRCAMWVGGVHRSLEDVTFEAMVREMVGRHAWKLSEHRAVELVDEWLGSIASAADDTPTGRYVQRRAAELERSR
ncbi:MAG: HipA domain-containing protein [Nitriliruptor sp.]|uniref:HipA domain-containing protein n=1 Tax=Nitriliruptor sp. TaxID=2448056 RepID=UPI0034A0A280